MRIFWARSLLVFASVLWLAPCFAQAPVKASFAPGTGIATLSNGLILVEYGLDNAGHLRLWNLGQPGKAAWVENGQPSSSPVHVLLDSGVLDDNTVYTLASVNSVNSEATTPAGKRLVMVLLAEDPPAEITLRAEVYAGQPFVRTSYTYVNLDQVQHTVLEARFGASRSQVLTGPVHAFYVEQFRRGTPLLFNTHDRNLDSDSHIVNVQGGAWGDHCTWLALRDGSRGMVIGWEFDGRGDLNAQYDPATQTLETWGGPDSLHAAVLPGLSFDVPPSFFGLYEGNWDEAGYRTQRFTEAVLAAPSPDDNFPWLGFDSWGYGQDINEDVLRKAADVAAQIGVEVFTVDLGWARAIGDWQEDPVKFPHGLSAFADYVRGLGMKFGLHFVPVEADPNAPVLQENPDWTSSVSYQYFGAQSLCLSNAPTQAWIQTQARGIMDRYHPDWITQDAENLVKECHKDSHTHDPLNSNWTNSVEGLDLLVATMRAEHPEALWENNADGGSMSSFAAVKRYATFASCDSCAELARRKAVYGMSYVFPPRFIDRYMVEAPSKISARSSMFGGPLILMQRISDWTPQQIATMKKEADLYKSLRGLIRDGKVFHLTARPDGNRVEAIESFLAAQNRGVVFVYRPSGSSDDSTMILPKGLKATGNYWVTFQESTTVLSGTGADLSKGITVPLPSKNFAEIVYITGQ